MLRPVLTSRLFTFLFVGLCLLPAAGLSENRGTATKPTPVATIDGFIVSEADLAQTVAGQLQQLRQQEYELKSKALGKIIAKRLLETEAAKQGITVDQLTDREVSAKIDEPTDAEVEAYYLAQRDKVQRPFSDVRMQLRQALHQAKILQAMEQYLSQLKANAKIRITLSPPRVQVADDPKRERGNVNAVVSIVEFSDYHCPFCKQAETVVAEVLAKYDGQVRVVYRDFPLDNLHPHARAAAEAASCAGDQGKFWQYHDALFTNAPKASADDLKAYAVLIGLDADQFDRCMKENTHRDLVQRDVEEATKLGITGTPAFFINGRFMNDAQPLEKFVQIIEEELAFTQKGASSAHR